MKAVTDTGPLIILAKMDRLSLLMQLYGRLYAPTCVKKELIFPQKAIDFLDTYVEVRDVYPDHQFVEAIGIEGCDIGVYSLYREIGADEMLFVNKKAEYRLGRYGKVRDVMNLKDIAEEKGVFSKDDSRAFLTDLKNLGYKPRLVDKELSRCR